jgi:UDP-N-acetylmuramoyl-tripeptide--D-alanyl-D-alanine ligase
VITLHDVLTGTAGRLMGVLDHHTLLANVVHDSRSVEPGDLFVALRGERLDGHDYIPSAVANGATAALVSEEWVAGAPNVPLPVIVVPDTLVALQALATYWRGLFDLTVVGITGSIGKSSTKEVVAAVLATRFEVVKSVGSYNNEIGLPLTVLRINPDSEVAVLEMGGAYAFGEIEQLVGIARPSIGIVTNVTHSHLARMGTLDAIAQTKAELVVGLPEGGVAILNHDDLLVRGMAAQSRARVMTYGLEPGADLRAVDLESLGTEGISFTLQRAGHSDVVQVPLMGRHSVYTALIGFAVGFEMGMAVPDILRGFSAPGVQLRLVLTPALNGATILDDHYNANPKSSFAALALLAELDATRHIAVLGDMLELGDVEEEGHRAVGQRAAGIVDALYTVGPRARLIGDEARVERPDLPTFHFDDKAALATALREDLREGDLVLIKGSRGVGMETVIAELRPTSGWNGA